MKVSLLYIVRPCLIKDVKGTPERKEGELWLLAKRCAPERLGRTCRFGAVCLMKKVLNIFSFVGSEERFREHL